MTYLTRSAVACLIFVFLVSLSVIINVCGADPAPPKEDGKAPVWQLTYLKAEPGQRERLERFITLNWFGPDDQARQKGYIDGFLLLRGSEDDPSWDLVVIDIFPDADSQGKARQRYRDEIMPGHKKQLVDGMDFPALGRIVGERTTTLVSGHVEAKRLGL
jgi:hypothetical protein